MGLSKNQQRAELSRQIIALQSLIVNTTFNMVNASANQLRELQLRLNMAMRTQNNLQRRRAQLGWVPFYLCNNNMAPLSPFSPRNKLVQANKSIYMTSTGKMYMIVPMLNRNGKIIKKQRVYLTPNSPYKPKSMNQIFPPKKRVTPPKRKSPPKPKNRTPTPKKRNSPFKMPAFPGWP